MSFDLSAIKIRHTKVLSGNIDANRLAHCAMGELAEARTLSSGTTLHWDDEALVAYHDSEAVGLIAYSHHQSTDSYYIGIGYVLPEYRRRGVYRAIWNRLVVEARKNKIPRIKGGSDVKNRPIHKVNDRLGRVVESITYVYEIPANGLT